MGCLVIYIGPVHSCTNSTLWEAYSPAAIFFKGAGNHSNTQAVTVQPDIHSLLGRESAHTGEEYCSRTQRHTAGAETRTKDLPVQSRRHIVTSPWCPAGIWSVYFRCRDAKVGHCQGACRLQSVVLFHPTQSQWDGSAIYVVMRATRDAQPPLMKGEKLISTNFIRAGIEPPTADLADERLCPLLRHFSRPPPPSHFNQQYVVPGLGPIWRPGKSFWNNLGLMHPEPPPPNLVGRGCAARSWFPAVPHLDQSLDTAM